MSTETMVERIGKVLEPQAWAAFGKLGKDSIAYGHRRTASLRKARAAIAAMRDPSDAMLLAMHHAREDDPGVTETWQAAIDAILSEEQP